jgi:hypothetical protein
MGAYGKAVISCAVPYCTLVIPIVVAVVVISLQCIQCSQCVDDYSSKYLYLFVIKC